MVWNETLKREIPEGWVASNLLRENVYNSDYTANGSFKSLADNVKYNDGEPYAILIRIVDFNDDFSDKNKFVYVNKHAYDFLKSSSLHGGEIIICNVGNAGATYRCPNLGIPMTLGPNGVMINDSFLNNYLFMYFTSEIGQQQLKSISSGSIQLKFNKTGLRNLPILMPPKALIRVFNEKYGLICQKMDSLWHEGRQMKQLRDFLLPLLMNGQVTLRS